MLDKSKRSKIASFVACCQKAKAEGIQIFRPVPGEAGLYEVKAFVEPPREDSDWVYLDAWTASVVCMVYDALTGEKREHFPLILPPRAMLPIPPPKRTASAHTTPCSLLSLLRTTIP